jgi:hypothetical protein
LTAGDRKIGRCRRPRLPYAPGVTGEVLTALGIAVTIVIALGAAERRRVIVEMTTDLEPGAKDYGELKGNQDFLVLTLTGKRNTAWVARAEVRGRGMLAVPGRAYTPGHLLGSRLPPGHRNKQKWALTDIRDHAKAGRLRVCWQDAERWHCKRLDRPTARTIAEYLTPAERHGLTP